MITIHDLEFLRLMRENAEEKRSRRARRILALYLGDRKPSDKALEDYLSRCRVVEKIEADIEREIESQAMAASV